MESNGMESNSSGMSEMRMTSDGIEWNGRVNGME